MESSTLYDMLAGLGLEGLIQRNNNYMAQCPFHSERNPSWGISLNPPHFHGCFACGAKGTLYTLLVGRFNMPEEDARVLADEKDLTLKFEQRHLFHLGDEEKYSPTQLDESELYPYALTKRAVSYLKSRGISPMVARKLGLVDNTEVNRLMIPWYYRGALIGVTGRTLVDNPAKTLPFYGTTKKMWLYMPSTEIKPGRFVVCEGELDAVKLYCAGQTNVGACCFGHFTVGQAKLLLNSPANPILFFFDDDKTGRMLQAEATRLLEGKKHIEAVQYGKYRKFYRGKKLDPGEMSIQHLKEITTTVSRTVNWPTF